MTIWEGREGLPGANVTDTRMTEHEVFQTHKVLEDKTLHKVHYDGPEGCRKWPPLSYVFFRSHAVILALRFLFSRFLFFIVCNLARTVNFWCSSNMLPKNCCSLKDKGKAGQCKLRSRSFSQKKAKFMLSNNRLANGPSGQGQVGRPASRWRAPGETAHLP